MISGQFGTIPIDAVAIGHRQRQRTRTEHDRLRRSIRERGLLHPIVIDRDGVLIAGEGRITACRELGWTHIPYQYADDLSDFDREMLELEENTLREDLTWEEQHDVYMRLIALLRSRTPDLTLDQLGEELNITKQTVSAHIIFEEKRDHPVVQQAARNGGFKTGYNAAVRVREREKADELIHTVPPDDATHQSPILTANFNEWAPIYTGPKFNLIHCDFPYGIDAHKSANQKSSLPVGYTDTEETHWTLFKTLSIHLDRFCAESAHLIFWFSPTLHCQTWEMLKLLDGFKFEEHPLIWIRGENEGIAPDPSRRPRRIYETAFFGWRGDRKILRVKANAITANVERERHPHEKSQRALEHFFAMCVDEHTRLLDPTCGSGSALRAARALGATTVLGLEQNEEYAEIARRALVG